MSEARALRARILAIGEWLLIAPAAVLLATAFLRLAQPRQYEPARTSWRIFEWASTHVSHSSAAILFLALPGLAAATGGAALVRGWRRDEALRNDTALTLAAGRRHQATIALALATLAAALIMAIVISHVLAD